MKVSFWFTSLAGLFFAIPVVAGDLPPNRHRVEEIARNAVLTKHPQLVGNGLELERVSYAYTPTVPEGISQEYFNVAFRIVDGIEDDGPEAELTTYYRRINVALDPDGTVTRVSAIQPYVMQVFDQDGSKTYLLGPAEPEELVLRPIPDSPFNRIPEFPLRMSLREILQTFCNLTGEELVVERNLHGKFSMLVRADGAPMDAAGAIHAIVAALGSRHILIEPIDGARSRVRRGTVAVSEMPAQ